MTQEFITESFITFCKNMMIDEVALEGKGVRKESNNIDSALVQLMMHMLKYIYQPSKQGPSWIQSIDKQRVELETVTRTAVLNNISDNLDKPFTKAKKKAAEITGVSIKKFPKEIYDDWTVENLRDPIWMEKFLHKYSQHPYALEYLDHPSRPQYEGNDVS